jgi:hypothetical protein
MRVTQQLNVAIGSASAVATLYGGAQIEICFYVPAPAQNPNAGFQCARRDRPALLQLRYLERLLASGIINRLWATSGAALTISARQPEVLGLCEFVLGIPGKALVPESLRDLEATLSSKSEKQLSNAVSNGNADSLTRS